MAKLKKNQVLPDNVALTLSVLMGKSELSTVRTLTMPALKPQLTKAPVRQVQTTRIRTERTFPVTGTA